MTTNHREVVVSMPQGTVIQEEASRTRSDAGPGRHDVVCVGETMALLVFEDHAPGSPPRFRSEIGGAESNVAVHLARAGRSPVWLSALGDDPFGHWIRERLGAEGVHCVARTDRDRPTGLYMKEPGPRGTRVRYWRRGSAASTLSRDDAAQVRRLLPRLVHTSGITAALSDSTAELVDELLRSPSRSMLRSFDVNYRPALHGDHNAGRLLELARGADIVFCGLDEGQALWGVHGLEELAALLHGPELIVIKQGAEGATAVRGGESWFAPAPQVEVVEPVGAGDAFAAGFLDRLLDGAPMSACLAEGARLAGTVLGVHGDIPPRRGPVRVACETGAALAQGPAHDE
ncbi:sugar kinase [Nocardiopsis sp. ATB16-24]|uniref:sugar kinase n=1 Tax=Nocardiopsis sp. ATB16-24 TaxID=3019555 RepID=UPI002554F432|nr:sugar kinase [Nocardiopsis sp. ATB16-24]